MSTYHLGHVCYGSFWKKGAPTRPWIASTLGWGTRRIKDRFANAGRPTLDVHMSSSALRHAAIIVRQWLADGLQRFSGVEPRIRKARDSVRKLKESAQNRGARGKVVHAWRKTTKHLASREEVLLFEASATAAAGATEMSLSPLDWKQLASAAINNAGDGQTLQYLMGCAGRLRAETALGFVLLGLDGEARHFLWVTGHDGFHLAEIDHKLEADNPDAAMIFDCWTPAAYRGHGYYATAIRLAAAQIERQDRRAWIFSAARNQASARGIGKAGFAYRYVLVRRKRLWRSSVNRYDNPGVGLTSAR